MTHRKLPPFVNRRPTPSQEGDYDLADELLEQAEEVDDEALREQQDALDRRKLSKARTRSERGELERARLNYRKAAAHFAEAARPGSGVGRRGPFRLSDETGDPCSTTRERSSATIRRWQRPSTSTGCHFEESASGRTRCLFEWAAIAQNESWQCACGPRGDA